MKLRLQLIRMAEAQRLVQDTPLSVAEIAGRVGYADASAMTRSFRRTFGLSPRAMRAPAVVTPGR